MSKENTEVVRAVRIALDPLSKGPSQRRTLDDRLAVRFPGVYRRLADAITRLPPRSRLRRLLVARRVRHAYAAANRRDFELVLTGWDPRSEYRPSADLTPPTSSLFSTAMTECASCGDIGSMHSKTSGGTPRKFSN